MNRCFLVINLDGFSEIASVPARFFQKMQSRPASAPPDAKITTFWVFRLEKCVF